MKTIRKNYYTLLKALQSNAPYKNQTINISDEEYASLEPYMRWYYEGQNKPEEPGDEPGGNEPIIIPDDPNNSEEPIITPETPEVQEYDYSDCDFGLNGFGYRIISMADSTVMLKKYVGINSIVNIPATVTYNNKEFNVIKVWSRYEDSHVWAAEPIGTAFSNNTNITKVIFPESIHDIQHSMFYGCNKLMSVSLPNDITFIPDYSFCGCESLTLIDIPSSVTDIADSYYNTFTNCPLSTIILRANVIYDLTKIFSNQIEFIRNVKFYVLPELIEQYESIYEKEIFLGKLQILNINDYDA